MKHFHVHISVPALDEALHGDSGLFAAEPTVHKPDYATWMLDDPRVNFAISQRRAAPGLNHLGVQVESGAELHEMQQRLDGMAAGSVAEPGTACCYARSDKDWTNDPVASPGRPITRSTPFPCSTTRPMATPAVSPRATQWQR